MAYGVLGMSVDTFESMTPADFLTALNGHMWKRERQYKDRAYMLMTIINTCGHLKKGKKVRLHDLFQDSYIDPRNPFYLKYMGIEWE